MGDNIIINTEDCIIKNKNEQEKKYSKYGRYFVLTSEIILY